MSLEIYYKDLNDVGQEKVNEFFLIEKAEDMNFDIVPLLIIQRDDMDEVDIIDVKDLGHLMKGIRDAQEGNFVDD